MQLFSKNENFKEVITLDNEVAATIVDDNGEVIDYVMVGDSIKIIRKEDKEKETERIKKYNECHVFNEGADFVKKYDKKFFKLRKILTPGELNFIVFLSDHICFKDNVLRTNGNTNGSILLDRELSEILDTPYNTTRKYMKTFIKYGIVGKFVTGCKEDPTHEIKCYIMNPYIFSRGNRINTEIVTYFDKTGWEKYLDE